MIVVDTSVWIDYLNDLATEQTEQVDLLLESEHLVGLAGPILTEVLLGFSDEQEVRGVSKQLLALPVLELDVIAGHIRAASIYRAARARGVTPRSTIDLLIAATCIEHDAWLLHNDRDFDHLAACSELKIWRPAA
ncbi:MAG: PIN domain nuclease [Solirubrobacterales bacterium]|nr:PIN domain nuclease [Solirubrobacterales bacterium]